MHPTDNKLLQEYEEQTIAGITKVLQCGGVDQSRGHRVRVFEKGHGGSCLGDLITPIYASTASETSR